MVSVNIPDALARRLQAMAEQENRSLDEFVVDLLLAHLAQLPKPHPGSQEAIIQSRLDADIRLDDTDLADRSREILNTEFVEHLRRKLSP